MLKTFSHPNASVTLKQVWVPHEIIFANTFQYSYIKPLISGWGFWEVFKKPKTGYLGAYRKTDGNDIDLSSRLLLQ